MRSGALRRADGPARPLAGRRTDHAVTREQLLILAELLEGSSGMRTRIVDQVTGPHLLRCWNPRVMGNSLQVTCQRHPRADGLAFVIDGEVIAAADNPEDIVTMLTERLGGRA